MKKDKPSSINVDKPSRYSPCRHMITDHASKEHGFCPEPSGPDGAPDVGFGIWRSS